MSLEGIRRKAKEKTPAQIRNAIGSIKGNINKKAPGWEKYVTYLQVWEEELEKKERGDFSGDYYSRSELPLDLVVGKKYVQLYESAIRRGKEFNLTHSDVRKLMTRKTCAYTGVSLTCGTTSGPKPTDRTIDRLDPSKGYVKGNVFAVSHQANQLKNRVLEHEDSVIFTDIKTLVKFAQSVHKLGFGK